MIPCFGINNTGTTLILNAIFLNLSAGKDSGPPTHRKEGFAMYGMNPGVIGFDGMYPGTMPAMNPSPYQYPAPSSFGAQNMMQPQPQQKPAQQTGPDWIQVATAQQVEQVNVQPGGKAWVMVQNAPVFALRVADNMGLVTTDYYRFEKIDQNAATGDTGSAQNAGNGMTREEVDALISERLSAFADSLNPAQRGKKGEPTE